MNATHQDVLLTDIAHISDFSTTSSLRTNCGALRHTSRHPPPHLCSMPTLHAAPTIVALCPCSLLPEETTTGMGGSCTITPQKPCVFSACGLAESPPMTAREGARSPPARKQCASSNHPYPQRQAHAQSPNKETCAFPWAPCSRAVPRRTVR
eukprot:scaffold241670_cov33-Tisochrysis_lutea.AAC.2